MENGWDFPNHFLYNVKRNKHHGCLLLREFCSAYKLSLGERLRNVTNPIRAKHETGFVCRDDKKIETTTRVVSIFLVLLRELESRTP